MKPRNLIILAAIVLAVAAYVFLFERHQPTTEEAKQQAEKLLPDLDRDRIAAVTIDVASGTVRLEKGGGSWRLAEPIDYPAAGSAVSSALGSLTNLEAERRLPVPEIDLSQYGLEPAAATVTLEIDDGSRLELAVGDELPLGSKRAVRIDAGDEVAVVPGWFVSDLERELDDWRSREVTDVMASDVASIDIRTGEDVIRAVRLEERWQLLAPLEDVADRDHLEALVSDLNSLQIEEFVDDDVDLEELGLVTPEYELTVVRSDGGEPLQLRLGATREDGGATLVACRRGSDDYFWARDGVRDRLRKAPVLWRSKKVAPFETWQVEALRLTGGERTAELLYEDGVWRFTDGSEADLGAVQERLRSLAELEAADYDLTAPLTDAMGAAVVVLEGDGGEAESEELRFTFYPPLSEGGRAMVEVSNRTTLMGVEASAAEAVVGDFGSLRPSVAEDDSEEAE